MAIVPRVNIVRLVVPDDASVQPVYVELENEFTITAGLAPNVNTVVVLAGELAKFGGNLARECNVEFWFDGAPGEQDPSTGGDARWSVRWDRWTVVDAEPLALGIILGQVGKTQPTHWRLYLADARQRFVMPRGGLLDQGEINRQPFDPDAGTDKNGNTVRTNTELANLCLQAMGAGLTAPAGLSDAPAVRDVEWRGAHAPTELAKLLDETGWAFTVRQDAGFRIVRIGEGTLEEPGNRAIVPGGITIPQTVERRGGVVVFTSLPTPALDTLTIKTIAPIADKGGFELVGPDDGWVWKPIDELSYLKGKKPRDIVRNGFDDVDPEKRRLAETYLYRCIRLDPKKFPKVRIVREVEESGKRPTNVRVKAMVDDRAQSYATGKPSVLLDVGVQSVLNPFGGGTVLVMDQRLGKTDLDVSVRPDRGFTDFGEGEFQATITVEAFFDDGRPKYFFCGFRRVLQGVVALTEEEVTAALGDKNTVIVGRPGLRLLKTEGKDQNRKELEDKCKAEAGRYLAGGDPARRHVWEGFANVPLSGRVNEIRLSQTPPLTTAEVMSWWLPRGNYYRLNKEATNGAGGAGSGGKSSDAPVANDRVARGASGAQQPAVPAEPPRQPPPPQMVVVKIVGKEKGGGLYTGKFVGGDPAKTSAEDSVQVTTLEKAGMKAGGDCLIFNLDEGNGAGTLTRDTHHGWLGSTTVPLYVEGFIVGVEQVGAGAKARPVVVVRLPHPMGTFYVQLTQDGGSNGNKTTLPSYTYTCKTAGGEILGKQKGPDFRQSRGLVTAATIGLGYYGAEREFKLLLAFETPGKGGC